MGEHGVEKDAPEMPTNATGWRLLPTVEGKAPGIVGWDPVVLQCSDCGATLTQPADQRIAYFMIQAGWNFHTCEGRTGKRRCRDCLATVEAACPRRSHA
jgi:hypothetical protein